MWNLLNLCTDKLYMLVSYLQDIASVALSFFTDFQRKQKDKKFSIYRFLSITNEKDDGLDSLFPPVTSSNLQTLAPQGPLVRQCAVSEFDFDYSAPTPIKWSDNNSKNTRNTNKSNVNNFTSTNNSNNNSSNNNNNNNNNNNTQHEYHGFDPDVLLSQFNASFNHQLAQTNVVDTPLDNHFVNTNYSLPLLELDQFKTSHDIPLSSSLPTESLDNDDDVPPLDDELFLSFFADRPTKRERQDTSPVTVDPDSDGEIDNDFNSGDIKFEHRITTTPSKIRKTGTINATDAPFVCEFCDVRFKVKGYLTRHVKKHYASKPFRCPYFDSTKTLSKENDDDNNNQADDVKDCNNNNDDNDTSHNDDNDSLSRCHITGGFSRRDTLNTHLKALHFIYPSGTKSVDRDRKSGHCGACFKEFSNNKEWLTQHIMTNSCSNIITKYK